MPLDLTDREWQIVRDQFRQCDGLMVRSDVVLAYPSAHLKRDADQIATRFQRAHDYLLAATPVVTSPKHFFGAHAGRIAFGYRHRSDETNGQPCSASWYGLENRVNIPWERLTTPESHPIAVRIEDQPEFAASHEIVHPFEHTFLHGGNRNVKWNEGFCDSLRVLVLEAMGLRNYGQEWEAMIKDAAARRTGNKYHDAAGRIFNWIEGHVGGRTNMTEANIRNSIQHLISNDMDRLLDPAGTIKF